MSDPTLPPPSDSLRRLAARIGARAGEDPETSYTARLLARGMEKCAQKLGEEAVEVVIAALGPERTQLVAESADLLYHLAVVWQLAGVTPDDIADELARREARSGLEEKAARKS
ncbi:MAG: phosphoribosyl-ATP diphosphatase [Alphaproteobacteria bacterium]|nr:phosphoribosyl-ATP diphosphatase [Alphaproteobacteria bacterium]